MAKKNRDTNPFVANPSWDEPTTRLWSAIVQLNHLDLAKQAIIDGANLSAVNPRGVSLMLAAVYHDCWDHSITSALLDAGVPLVEPNGTSPALEAAKKFLDNGETFRFLQARARAIEERSALNADIESGAQRPAPRI